MRPKKSKNRPERYKNGTVKVVFFVGVYRPWPPQFGLREQTIVRFAMGYGGSVGLRAAVAGRGRGAGLRRPGAPRKPIKALGPRPRLALFWVSVK